MTRSNFENLEVYQVSEKIADEVWRIVGTWDSLARDTVGKQLVRAADSIGANIAEGEGRGSFKDNQRFVRIARGSLNETKHWLRRAYHRKLLNEQSINSEAAPRRACPAPQRLPQFHRQNQAATPVNNEQLTTDY